MADKKAHRDTGRMKTGRGEPTTEEIEHERMKGLRGVSAADAPAILYGGSFAPRVTKEQIADYRELAKELDAKDPVEGAIREHMQKLCDMVEEFVKTPDSGLRGKPHRSGTGTVVKLEKKEIERMDEHVPWAHEVEALKGLFDKLSPAEKGGAYHDGQVGHKDIRDAAHHLLWYAVELCQDREPMTLDRL